MIIKPNNRGQFMKRLLLAGVSVLASLALLPRVPPIFQPQCPGRLRPSRRHPYSVGPVAISVEMSVTAGGGRVFLTSHRMAVSSRMATQAYLFRWIRAESAVDNSAAIINSLLHGWSASKATFPQPIYLAALPPRGPVILSTSRLIGSQAPQRASVIPGIAGSYMQRAVPPGQTINMPPTMAGTGMTRPKPGKRPDRRGRA